MKVALNVFVDKPNGRFTEEQLSSMELSLMSFKTSIEAIVRKSPIRDSMIVHVDGYTYDYKIFREKP